MYFQAIYRDPTTFHTIYNDGLLRPLLAHQPSGQVYLLAMMMLTFAPWRVSISAHENPPFFPVNTIKLVDFPMPMLVSGRKTTQLYRDYIISIFKSWEDSDFIERFWFWQ